MADAQAYNSFAWFLATCEPAGLRNPPLAVELATKGVELALRDAIILNTLGVAQYRAGQWDDAILSLNKAEDSALPQKLRFFGISKHFAFDGFFLAMAHWQLGHKEEARTWYDRSVEWMEKNEPKNDELIRFRTETEQLLCITQPSPTPSDPPPGDDVPTPKN